MQFISLSTKSLFIFVIFVTELLLNSPLLQIVPQNSTNCSYSDLNAARK